MNNNKKNSNTQRLKTEFKGRGEVKGYTFTKILENDYAFIYKKQFSNKVSYEVFEKRINKRFNCISYPTSKSFGVWAFEIINLKKAIKKYNYLSNH